MPVARFAAAGGLRFACGRNAPLIAPAAPRLERFIFSSLAPPPPSVRADWATGPALNRAGLENIKANDQLGCCLEAACANIINVWHGDAGTGDSITADQTVAFYSASSGYVAGDPSTDQGSDEATVFAYWKENGFPPGAPPIAGLTLVDPSNIIAVKTAISLFGHVIMGGALLKSWVAGMDTMASGFTWTNSGDPDQRAGHAFMAYGYNAIGVFICTWGMFGILTWAGLAKFASAATGGFCACILSQDWIRRGSLVSPSGLDFAQLDAALGALA